MKKRIIIPLLISTLSLSGCCLFSHDFAEATCTTPSTCTKCGEIQGEALGHTFTDATCTEAKTCSVCNFAEGNPLEHQWLEATTENPKTCDRCGLTEGEPLQDDFSQAKIDDHEVKIETEPEVEVEPGEVIDLHEADTEEEKTLEEEMNELLSREIPGVGELSPHAGTTSKHGWKYPDDYVRYRENDTGLCRSDIESDFDDGILTEEEYQFGLDLLGGRESTAEPQGTMQGAAEDWANDVVSENPIDGGSSTPATGPSDMEFPEGPSYEPDGRICY